jgi:hypothetical protein
MGAAARAGIKSATGATATAARARSNSTNTRHGELTLPACGTLQPCTHL